MGLWLNKDWRLRDDFLKFLTNNLTITIMEKYELTEETIKVEGVTLYRIKALKDFGNVKKGDLGGFVQSEMNLSHYGNCWIYNDAKVYGLVRVFW